MLLLLPSLLPLFVAVAWGPAPHDPSGAPAGNAGSIPPVQPALPPWMDEPGWAAYSTALEQPAPKGIANSSYVPSQSSDQTLRIPLAGSVSFFGQAEKDILVSPQGPRFIGQTGLTWKMPIQPGVEFLLSCGPEVTYVDVLRPDRLQDHPFLPFQTRLLRLDVQCRWRLSGQLGLECQGSVCPALNPGEQDAFRHDLHLALPLCNGGEFHLGAKYYWERTTEIKPVPDSGQVYGDFRLIW
jgi:hypothetical protein